jgi:spectinomycin phosphotransferase
VRALAVGVEQRELIVALADGWRIDAVTADYAAVGGGSYHWVVRAGEGKRCFVTVDDLDRKGWLGETRTAAFQRLRIAMDTALLLRSQGALEFVVAPIPALDGETLRPLGSKYALAVFPFLSGRGGHFGDDLSGQERAELVDMLAALHRSTSAAVGAPWCQFRLPRRDALDAALSELDHPWPGGPFAEPARALLVEHAEPVRRLLKTFDQLADRVAAAGHDPVITHGEPHPGNVVRIGTERRLVDWDTVGLAPPERDLWMVARPTGEELRRYMDVTGRALDTAALAFYRLRWALDDISVFINDLRSEHRHTPDSEHAWRGLKITVERVAP